MTSWARFWAVDFHVHTPGSQDANDENYGSPQDIVNAAIAAKLDAIVITDHNTVSWCKDVADAAEGTSLVVLPGVEISTTEGHLLALWEQGTDPGLIEEVLVKLNIGQAARGKLDIAANGGFSLAADKVAASGGVAIPAHIEKEKGLMRLTVKAHVKDILLDGAISAVEVVHLDTIEDVRNSLSDSRDLAFVRGSDTWDKDQSCHALSGIGARRTWIKASRPDLVGIRHALADPALRISLEEPPTPASYACIEDIEFFGGFLGGQRIELSPDLNCLLGGTGAGKSLILEATRFALNQQVDIDAFPSIRREIDSRMAKALMDNSVVVLHMTCDGERYRIERTFNVGGSPTARVLQQTGIDWAEVDVDPATLCPIAAFSQGEILEYSREPVGRMTLVDASIDLDEVNGSISSGIDDLRANARKLIATRCRVQRLESEATEETELSEQVRQLTDLFKTETVKEQSSWTKEQTSLQRAKKNIDDIELPDFDLPDVQISELIAGNAGVFIEVGAALERLHQRVGTGRKEIGEALTEASGVLARIQGEWTTRFEGFKQRLDEELEKIDPGASLTSLRASLEQLQSKLTHAQASKTELDARALPELDKLQQEREELITALHDARRKRREMRRARVVELNTKAAGFVKLDIPSQGDESDFRDALDRIKVGSRVRDDFLNQLALRTHPLKFARCMWTQALADLVDTEHGIDMANLAKLLANIDERNLWEELLELQSIDRPDVLTVKFKKPDDHTYTAIEELAHGQRCTAILVILLADGDTPVLVDQPEDALHAPWIEEYLVDRLRSLRGSRQYLFATRSPGIVVSGDAEQIVTMKATAGHGEVEAVGSLERYELNALALEHLEGGRVPFNRRALKLKVSVAAAGERRRG
ncbi:ATPase involved in DNA repair [Mycobacteroides abscessus subsp. bolletii]|uniref:PHP domain-containing protein n=1 Tax=Mycobacteroides abscessus TaxID=36809 RepID=UPI0009A57A5F|nr:AAA family ATPase [Mycobacteroides abscessus]SKX88823.1 ATPase involved in DNA repair [Mycobacteroides abscessus subsp. bolletii]